MRIQIEKQINLTTYAGNTTPKVVEQLAIIHEATDGELVQYYIDPKSKSEGDKNTYAIGVYDEKTKEYSYVDYDEVIWNKPKKRITSQKIDRLGLKAFPGIGAIAFYKLAYRNTSKILAPVNTKSTKYNAPTFTMEETDTTFIFHCSSPKDVTYACYRIILRLEKFAHEYITYEETLEVPKPATTGTYDIYCVGYIHEGEAVSEDSKHYSVDVVGTQEEWPGPQENSDIFIKDLEITTDNKVRFMRSDGFDKTSDNAVNFTGYATTQQLTEAIQQAIQDSWEANY